MKTHKIKHLDRCSSCGTECEFTAKVRINLTNPWRRYQGSGRPMLNIHTYRLCKKCYPRFEKLIDKLIEQF